MAELQTNELPQFVSCEVIYTRYSDPILVNQSYLAEVGLGIGELNSKRWRELVKNAFGDYIEIIGAIEDTHAILSADVTNIDGTSESILELTEDLDNYIDALTLYAKNQKRIQMLLKNEDPNVRFGDRTREMIEEIEEVGLEKIKIDIYNLIQVWERDKDSKLSEWKGKLISAGDAEA